MPAMAGYAAKHQVKAAVKTQAPSHPAAGSGQNRSEGEAISAGARVAYFKVSTAGTPHPKPRSQGPCAADVTVVRPCNPMLVHAPMLAALQDAGQAYDNTTTLCFYGKAFSAACSLQRVLLT